MPEGSTHSLLDRARCAADRGAWQQACDLLAEADRTRALEGRDLELFAQTAYAAGHLDLTIETWERAHARALERNDHLSAAAAATRVALHLLFDTALLAPIRGWAGRAERLLTDDDDTPVHAWLAVVRAYERLLSGDVAAAQRWARRAVDVGSGRDPAAAAIGRVAEARALIVQGDVGPGLTLLNEAAVAAVSGEIDPLSTGVVYCEVVCAMQGIGQYDLAEQWTEAMERWCAGRSVGSMHGRCRLHRAEILRLRGASESAEAEALRACDELRPYLRREFGWPLTELGRIRLRKGDLPGAESAFLAAHAAGWDPQPGLALVRLAQGDGVAAVALIRQALEHPMNVPSKELPPNTDLRRAPLLDAQVEIELTAGDAARAQSAAEELGRIGAAFESAAFTTAAIVAQGRIRLANGEAADAIAPLESAAHRWVQMGAPYEAAVARLLLGQALRATGNDARADLEIAAARATCESIGAVPPATADATPAAAIMAAPPAPSPAVDAAAVDLGNRFALEGEYWSVEFNARACRLRDAKGLQYLSRLLTHPGREFHAVDLVVHANGAGPADIVAQVDAIRASRDAGELLDRRARDAYRRRLAEIDEDIEEARGAGDAVRAEQAIADREFLARELARAVGLGGRSRRTGSPSERARASVTRAIRHAMQRVHKHHPDLGIHLDRTIRTGTYCVYLPDPRVPIRWIVLHDSGTGVDGVRMVPSTRARHIRRAR